MELSTTGGGAGSGNFPLRKIIANLKKKVSNFKPKYILSLPNRMVAHALVYWPNVGPSLPQSPNLTSLRKLQYTSTRTNVTHAI